MSRHVDLSGANEFPATSEDELQNASAKDDDSVTVVTTGDDDNLSQGHLSQGPSTPVKKVKKRKEGSENGSVKKKQKKVDVLKF
jgi:hypothetical protein